MRWLLIGPLLFASCGGRVSREITADAGSVGPTTFGCEPPTDVAVDPLNCGACGKDCQGGGCNDGTCTPPPSTLVQYLPKPVSNAGCAAMALDDERLYWTDDVNGTISSCLKSACSPQTLVSGHARPCAITLDGNTMAWLDCGDGTLWRAEKSGAAPQRVASLAASFGRSIAADAGELFFSDSTGVYRVPLAGGRAQMLSSSREQQPAWTLRVGPRHVYASFNFTQNGLLRLDRSNGNNAREIFSSPDWLMSFVLLADTAFVMTQNLTTNVGQLNELSGISASPMPLATGEAQPDFASGSLASDGHSLFWTSGEYEGVVHAAPLDHSAAPRTIVSGHFPGESGWYVPCDLLVDETDLYIAVATKILQLPK